MISKIFKRKWVVFVCLVIVFLGILCSFFYIRHHVQHMVKLTDTISYFGDVREGFFNFKENEERFPVCMDEAVLAPYNKNLLQYDNMDLFSGLPLRCVTLRNMYYYVGGKNYKVLVTLYKPYQAQLWPFSEKKTIVMLEDGNICIISPKEIIEE